MIHSNPDLIASYLMRKQFQSRGDDLLAGWDFTSGWTTSNATINDADTFTIDVSAGYIRKSAIITIGKRYRMTIAGTAAGGITNFYVIGGTVIAKQNITGTFDESFDFTATGATWIDLKAIGTGQIDITKLELYPVTLMDLSGNGNDAVIFPGTGGFTTGPDGKANGAYEFDGVNTFIDCGNDASLSNATELSVIVWVKSANSPSEEEVIVDKYLTTGNKREWRLGVEHDDKLQIKFGDPADGTFEGTVKTDDAVSNITNWHHVGFTYDTGTVFVYVDGVSVNYSVYPGAIPSTLATNLAKLVIGALNEGTSNYYDGFIANVEIYNAVYGQDWVSHQYKKFQQQIQSGRFKGLI